LSKAQQLDLRKIALGVEYKRYKFIVYMYGESEIIELMDTERPTPMRVKDAYCRKHGNFDHYRDLKVRSVEE
jgi:hypothetical protein